MPKAEEVMTHGGISIDEVSTFIKNKGGKINGKDGRSVKKFETIMVE